MNGKEKSDSNSINPVAEWNVTFQKTGRPARVLGKCRKNFVTKCVRERLNNFTGLRIEYVWNTTFYLFFFIEVFEYNCWVSNCFRRRSTRTTTVWKYTFRVNQRTNRLSVLSSSHVWTQFISYFVNRIFGEQTPTSSVTYRFISVKRETALVFTRSTTMNNIRRKRWNRLTPCYGFFFFLNVGCLISCETNRIARRDKS